MQWCFRWLTFDADCCCLHRLPLPRYSIPLALRRGGGGGTPCNSHLALRNPPQLASQRGAYRQKLLLPHAQPKPCSEIEALLPPSQK